jgi:DNA-binding beta-propeller fold protein YncE
MNRLLAIGFCVMISLMAGCAPEWSVSAAKSPIELQWPYQPNRPKATYVEAITGFKLKGSAASLLHTAVYGKGRGSQDVFTTPVAVATGKDGRMAIADTGCRCVHLYVPEGHRYLRLAHGGEASLSSPVGVIFDDQLNLYVSDSTAGRIFVFGRDGKYLRSFTGADGHALLRPTGLAYNWRDKLLYVADTVANRIYAYDSIGNVVFSFGGRGEEQSEFNYPTHIFWSPAGILYVTDTLNFRIEMFDSRGGFLGSFGHHGDGSGDLAMPKGIAADSDGVIYVVDGLFDNVQLFSPKGTFLLTLGSRGTDYGEFWLPSGEFIDGNGILYVCDTYNRRIQVFRLTPGYSDGKF